MATTDDEATLSERARASVEPRFGPAARIILADDDPGRAAALSDLLRSPSLDAEVASSAGAALRCLSSSRVAAILIDLGAATIDGHALASAVRRSRFPQVPILFLADREGDFGSLYESPGGVVDVVVRPADPRVLRAKVGLFVALLHRGLQARHLLARGLRDRRETARAQAELRLREQHQSLVLRALPIAFYTAQASAVDHRRFIGDGIEALTGFTALDFAARPDLWEANLHPFDVKRVWAGLERLAAEGAATLDYRWRHADRTERHVLDHCVVHRDEEGAPQEIYGIWLDVTEQRSLEMDRRHASKLEAVGRLTGGIAHDFRNMLAVTIGSLELLQGGGIARQEEAWQRTQIALHAARGCADLSQRLLSLSRREALSVDLIDLRAHLPKMLDLVRRALGVHIRVELEMPDELSPVSVNTSQLDNAVLNLALNARDAMPAGGRLTVSLAEHGPDLAGGGTRSGGDFIEVAVTDTGVGMSPAVLDKAMDAFFTTKDEGGTGLGLSMIQGFAEQAGGEVRIESREGEGTTVRLRLPSASLDTDGGRLSDELPERRRESA